MPNCEYCSDLEVCDQCQEGYLLNADNNECLGIELFRNYYHLDYCVGEKESDFMLAFDDADDYEDEYYYGCMECKEGFWLNDEL